MLARRSLAVLKSGIEEGLFSGVAYALASKKLSGGAGTLGRLSFDPESDRVNRNTLFDIASLTKPLATAMAILQLVDRGKLKIESNVSNLIGGAVNLIGVTVFQLLTHTSGLPAVPCADNDAAPLQAALGALLESAPGSECRYSDTGYIVLGEIVNRAAGVPLDVWFRDEIARPLRLSDSGFKPDVALPIAATTEDEQYDGLPHDPRSRAMGGVAGHAGLFASVNDVAAYARALLGSGKALIGSELFARLFANELDPDVGFQSLGFFTGGNPLLPGGTGFGHDAVGHSGFTGCFMMIDRQNEASACLLTNRVLNSSDDASRFLALRREWLAAAAFDLGLATD